LKRKEKILQLLKELLIDPRFLGSVLIQRNKGNQINPILFSNLQMKIVERKINQIIQGILIAHKRKPPKNSSSTKLGAKII
jgi:hypothetical protein